MSEERSTSEASRLAVITGTSGLGLETAKVLARSGYRIVLAGRNGSMGQAAVRTIGSQDPDAAVRFEELDLANLISVGAFAARMRKRGEAIDVLVNNAGVMMPPARQTTAQGHELQFGVNYLGHFALTAGLLPLLGAGSRVVSVTSLAHRYGGLDLDAIKNPASYWAGPAYCASKLLQAMFAVELQQRSAAQGWGIVSLAAHPGFASTNFFQGSEKRRTPRSLFFTKIVAPLLGQTPANGALPIAHAAMASDVVGGRLFGPKGFLEMKGPPGECAFAASVHDAALRLRAWEMSEDLIGYRFGDTPAHADRGEYV